MKDNVKYSLIIFIGIIGIVGIINIPEVKDLFDISMPTHEEIINEYVSDTTNYEAFINIIEKYENINTDHIEYFYTSKGILFVDYKNGLRRQKCESIYPDLSSYMRKKFFRSIFFTEITVLHTGRISNDGNNYIIRHYHDLF